MDHIRTMALGIILLLSASFVSFHHGWADYDQTKVLDFTTAVETSVYENPHALAQVKYKGDMWTVYLAPASRMASRGVTAEMIQKGTEIRIVAYPHKKKKTEMRAERIFVGGKKFELR